jgi:hypothetical protein
VNDPCFILVRSWSIHSTVAFVSLNTQISLPSIAASPAGSYLRSHRIASAVLVLALGAGTLCVLSAVGYCVGTNTESELRFFEPRRAPTSDEAIIACPIEYALQSNEKNDVIFVGDSTCHSGIDAAYFERLSGLRTYNLGSQGRLGPMGFLITAKAYLSRHPPPQIVALCMSPVAFEHGAAEFSDKMGSTMLERFEANYGPEVPGLIPQGESLRYFIKRGSVEAWTAASSSFTRRDQDIRDVPISGVGSTTYRMYQRLMRESRGYLPLTGSHGKRLELESLGEPVKIDPEWDRNVRLLAESCESMGIPLLIRFSPMPNDLSHAKDFSPIERWAQDLQRSYRHVIVGLPTLLWYDPELCWDHIHLNSRGVAVYMALLAKDARAALGIAGRPKH